MKGSTYTYMSSTLLLDARDLKVFIGHLNVTAHLLERLNRDSLDPKLSLALSKGQPKLPPGGMSASLAEEFRHFRTAVPGRQ